METIVSINCHSCGASGIYRGMAEPAGTAVVCLTCKGSGAVSGVKRGAALQGKYSVLFTGRKIKTGVDTVYNTKGTLIFGPMGPGGNGVSYQDFLNGKMPS